MKKSERLIGAFALVASVGLGGCVGMPTTYSPDQGRDIGRGIGMMVGAGAGATIANKYGRDSEEYRWIAPVVGGWAARDIGGAVGEAWAENRGYGQQSYRCSTDNYGRERCTSERTGWRRTPY